MKKVLLVSGLIFMLTSLFIYVEGKEKSPVNSGTHFAKDALQKYVDSGEIPGAICIYYKDGVQETTCLGYAEISTKRPITIDSFFMQCSQTKGFCGVTIAILVEEGKLSLDDPVSKYLPEFSELWIQESNVDGVRKLVKAKNQLTVRMVMNHTGGFSFELPNYMRMGGWSHRMPLRSVATMAAALPLSFEPGTRIQYSNVGIDIGAAIVEVVSRQRWEDFLKQRVLDPLEMKDSTFWPSNKQLETKLELYKIEPDKPATIIKQSPAMQLPFNGDRVFPSAGAGLWTTARDQLKFYKMLMNLGVGDNGVRILKEETVKSILALSSRPKGFGGYSLGLYAPATDDENQWFGHGGAFLTRCFVNWHKRQLKLVAVQFTGKCDKIEKAHNEAAEKFFQEQFNNSGENEYTGRME